MPALFSPVSVGPYQLEHRVVLAPLTRTRAAEPSLAPRDMNVEYYAQRASKGGLLIGEATLISPEGLGVPHAPGIWTADQVAGWRRVTEAVHAKGARIFCQLWHQGRVCHQSFAEHPLAQAPGASLPGVGPSPVIMKGKATTYGGREMYTEPCRELRTDEIPRLVEDYRHAARQALAAGFDGVELHAAHGYLIDQFLCDGTNKRTDRYGGSIENRCRLLFEVMEALCAVAGPGKVACRLSPTTKGSMSYYQCSDSNPEALYAHAVAGLNRFPVAYLLISEPRWLLSEAQRGPTPEADKSFAAPLTNAPVYRKLFRGLLIGAGGFTPEGAQRAVASGDYDLVAFGRWFISNPDLPARLRSGGPLTVYDRPTFYTYGSEGYTDYPDAVGSYGARGKYRTVSQAAIGANLSETLAAAGKAKL
eukprot:TRINITY_DN13020_c0_g2_i1.p1 TRINITY_DN13020_c0_g2~~TRINITY_DN13020_c0_g2_i1.p1  ORF type:complete len:445 (+),score=151.07 TRINITY_DN13020_c0_g2_i1:80-1336(+)